MNVAALIRGAIYIGGAVAMGLQIKGFGTWDAATMTFDLYPFRIDEAIKSAVSGGANLMAMLMVWRQSWGRR